MPDESINTRVALETELTVSRLDSLSTLPCIAAKFFPRLLQGRFTPSALADIIESDPALAGRILSLIEQRGAGLPDGRFSLRQGLDKLPANDVRDAVLSIKVSQAFDLDDGIDKERAATKKNLLLHSLAVACCAKDIAKAASPQMDSELAYFAGLLHDIGKLALEETMPKSFAGMIEEAKSTKKCLRVIEQKHLGTDHTIIGKRLGQQWRLPHLIVLAIWLHHSQTVTIAEDMPEARIAAVVQLADSIAHRSGIGWAGSFDSPEPIETISQWLAISPEQKQQISSKLPETIRQKSNILGLYLPKAGANYCKIVHGGAAQLARQHTELSNQNQRLQSDSIHLDFITDFLSGINSMSTAIDIAENFATRWQQFYQTGMVCLYLAPPGGSQTLEAVVVEELSHSRMVCLNASVETSVIPKTIANNFAILDAYDYIDWLFEQLDVEFDANRTKMMPLLSGGKAIGVIAFELNYPGDAELFEEKFRTSASIGGSALGMALAQQKQQRFAERFAQLISKPMDIQAQTAPADNSLNALAEMAAGAAHELNNPLAVISGRAQLLAEAESDQEKKRMLEQIYENSREASAIIENLMGFAEPPKPRAARTDVKQMLDEAIELAKQKINAANIDVQIAIAEDIESIFLDSAQAVSAIANVISNAAESYGEKAGPITIAAEAAESGDSIKLQISDNGCGMDAETVQKAAQPFFSVKAAGRKRGMGLAYAVRFIQLNKGSLSITSKPGSGTTVTICLPCK
ncbi:MAG: HDOD domain-containing protein [Planctomycetes bacterium]|nr:HDOD domain-containing protein [Planctomycetota bacterium]MBL7143294.1 HDOD domain-containing protein [Phycisphaerae bacterium]